MHFLLVFLLEFAGEVLRGRNPQRRGKIVTVAVSSRSQSYLPQFDSVDSFPIDKQYTPFQSPPCGPSLLQHFLTENCGLIKLLLRKSNKDDHIVLQGEQMSPCAALENSIELKCIIVYKRLHLDLPYQHPRDLKNALFIRERPNHPLGAHLRALLLKMPMTKLRSLIICSKSSWRVSELSGAVFGW